MIITVQEERVNEVLNVLIHVLWKNVIFTTIIFYDDASHLKRYAQNPVRKDASDITRKMATMDMVCDRFHFANHTDKWCKKKCNPFKTANLCNQRK